MATKRSGSGGSKKSGGTSRKSTVTKKGGQGRSNKAIKPIKPPKKS